MDYVSTVIVFRQDSDGEGALIGIYADDFTARRVAREYKLQDDEYICAGDWPVFTTALTIGDDNVPAEASVTYQRNGWDS